MFKKILALTLASVMAFSMTVFAANSPAAGTIQSGSCSTEAAPVVAAPAAKESSAPAAVDGIPAAVVATAAAQSMSVGEVMNNAITETPGLPAADVMPVAQGGHVVINGAPSNITFNVFKANAVEVKAAKQIATEVGGKVINILKVKGPGKFNTATVNFFVKGMKAGVNVKVYSIVNGQMKEVVVKEIREDHVVVDMTEYGTLVFVVL